jgi:hypothetical protein
MAATYKSRILRWDWAAIVRTAEVEAIEHIASGGESICRDGCDDDGHVGSYYLGSVMSIYPSGKFYMPWTTNQTADDVDRDSRFGEALDGVASAFGGWIESGDGDPTDLYFMRYFGSPERND